MKVWILLFNNVDGDDWVELYSTKEKAKAALKDYAKDNKDKKEFYSSPDGQYISWFDPDINYRNAEIYILEQKVH